MKNLYIWCMLFIVSCKSFSDGGKQSELENVSVQEIKYKVITDSLKSYGYEVFVDEKLVISQPNVPGIQGVVGFETAELASKTAELVVLKITQGQFPPTVTKFELTQLGVIME